MAIRQQTSTSVESFSTADSSSPDKPQTQRSPRAREATPPPRRPKSRAKHPPTAAPTRTPKTAPLPNEPTQPGSLQCSHCELTPLAQKALQTQCSHDSREPRRPRTRRPHSRPRPEKQNARTGTARMPTQRPERPELTHPAADPADTDAVAPNDTERAARLRRPRDTKHTSGLTRSGATPLSP